MFIVFFRRNFKQTLIELERTYSILIDVEDCEKKLTALPTGTSMRLKVKDKWIFMQSIMSKIVKPNRLFFEYNNVSCKINTLRWREKKHKPWVFYDVVLLVTHQSSKSTWWYVKARHCWVEHFDYSMKKTWK